MGSQQNLASNSNKSLQDECLMNHISKHNLLKPIVDAFVANRGRYNLLSSILGLFEYIRKENLKILLRYLVDTFWIQLIQFRSVPSIHSLKIKFELILESSGTRTISAVIDPRKRTRERALQKEEDHFKEDSDEEDSASALSHTIMKQSHATLPNGSALSSPSVRPYKLVDNANGEDDENYKPPPKKQPVFADKDVGS